MLFKRGSLNGSVILIFFACETESIGLGLSDYFALTNGENYAKVMLFGKCALTPFLAIRHGSAAKYLKKG